MENLEIKSLFKGIYLNKRVLITGHTGFKGSWLTLWLNELGAQIMGYSLNPPTDPSHYEILNLGIKSVIADIRDFQKLERTIKEFQPEIIFHLAAQPLVLYSYKHPVETYTTNVIGTINLLEACRKFKKVKAVINITSDKCYENKEWIWGYREIDPLGGYDPYSSSKGCAELVTNAYRRSYFNLKNGDKKTTLIASARAGNVIGGGDWADDRLIPDLIRAINKHKKILIRNPNSIRPWQHVLEPLSGYLLLGQKLLESNSDFAEAWNFGPDDVEFINVLELIKRIKKIWSIFEYEVQNNNKKLHEANLLKLDCSKAKNKLKWESIWDCQKTIERTIAWYRKYYETGELMSKDDLKSYILDAKLKRVNWINK